MEQELGTTHDGREQGLTRSRRHARRLKKPTKPAEQSNSGRSIGIRDFFGPHKFMGPVRSNRWHMLRPGPAGFDQASSESMLLRLGHPTLFLEEVPEISRSYWQVLQFSYI